MRRMIALCMAACMALSLTACGSKDAPSGSAGQGSQSSSASQQETVTVPPVEDLTGVDTSSIPGLEDGVLVPELTDVPAAAEYQCYLLLRK